MYVFASETDDISVDNIDFENEESGVGDVVIDIDRLISFITWSVTEVITISGL